MEQDDLIHSPQGDPPTTADEAEVQQFFQMISYQAPLPPPGMLEAYERILPGAAKRIFDRMERQADHRQWMERTTIQANVAAQRNGQWLGFVIALIGLCGGFALIWNGSNAIGLAIFIATLASFTTVFIYGKRKQGKILERQLQQIKDLIPHVLREGGREGDQRESES